MPFKPLLIVALLASLQVASAQAAPAAASDEMEKLLAEKGLLGQLELALAAEAVKPTPKSTAMIQRIAPQSPPGPPDATFTEGQRFARPWPFCSSN